MWIAKQIRGSLMAVFLSFLSGCVEVEVPTDILHHKNNSSSVYAIADCDAKNELIFECYDDRIVLQMYSIGPELYWFGEVGLVFATEDWLMNRQVVLLTKMDYFGEQVSLGELIDPKNWRQLGSFYRDDDNVYCYNPHNGGTLNFIAGIHPDDLVFLDDYTGADKKLLSAIKISDTEAESNGIASDGEKILDSLCRVTSVN